MAAEIETESDLPDAPEDGRTHVRPPTGLAASRPPIRRSVRSISRRASQAFAMIVGAFAAGERDPATGCSPNRVPQLSKHKLRAERTAKMEVRDIKVAPPIDESTGGGHNAVAAFEFESEENRGNQ